MYSPPNKTFADTLRLAFNQGDIDALDGLIAPQCVDHTAVPGQLSGLAGVKQAWAQLRYIFPGGELTDKNMILDHDQVAVQATFLIETSEQPPIEATLVEVFRLVNGKAAELWNVLRWN